MFRKFKNYQIENNSISGYLLSSVPD